MPDRKEIQQTKAKQVAREAKKKGLAGVRNGEGLDACSTELLHHPMPQ